MLEGMSDRDVAKRRMLRTVCVVAGALGVGMLALGALPGFAVYADSANCFGRAFAGVFSHGHASPCESSYVLHHTERVIDEPLSWLALVGILGFGVLVWVRPKLRFALLWSLATVGLGALAVVASFELHLFDRVVQLWPSQVFGLLAVALIFLLIAFVPAACAVFLWIYRTRPTPPPELPRATVVER
jgi:hypothetical protein